MCPRVQDRTLASPVSRKREQHRCRYQDTRMIDLGAREHGRNIGWGRLDYLTASCDQDPTIIQQGGRVTIPVRGHIAGIAERAGDGIIEFGTVDG